MRCGRDRDHVANADQLVASGAGDALFVGQVTRENLADRIRRLLDDPVPRASARALGVEMDSLPKASAVARHIAEFCTGKAA